MEKIRLDVLLAQKQNISREKASKMIQAEKVLYKNKIVKSSLKISEEDFLYVEILENDLLKYVSRGGLKLEKALEEFQINVREKKAIDVGSSTGGFTHCLLNNGIYKVIAVDTGTMQMDNAIRFDDRVVLKENTNILDLHNENADVITIDVSFVSTTKIMDKVKDLLTADGDIVLLLKPQFEVGKKYLNKKGVVKDKKIIDKTMENLFLFYEGIGLKVIKHIQSPILGGDGNVEYLVHLKKGE